MVTLYYEGPPISFRPDGQEVCNANKEEYEYYDYGEEEECVEDPNTEITVSLKACKYGSNPRSLD